MPDGEDIGPAVEQAVDFLTTAQETTKALGQQTQDLHGRAAAFDPAAPTADSEAQRLLEDVIRYLGVHDSTLVLIGLDARLPVIRAGLGSGAEAEQIEALLGEGEMLIQDVMNQTRYLESATGIGAETLLAIRDELRSGRWRDAPEEARGQLQAAAESFQASDDNVRWLDLSRRVAALQQELLGVASADGLGDG